jgi:hypothetical protein
MWRGRSTATAPPDTEIVLFDRAAGREAYRLNVSPYLGRAALEAKYRLNFALGAAGTVVASVPNSDPSPWRDTLVWASVGDPTPHVIAAGPATLAVALGGQLIAIRRGPPYDDFAVIDLHGAVHDTFDYNDGFAPFSAFPYGIDFDGHELTWLENGGVHIAAYPVEPAPDVRTGRVAVSGAAASIRVWCPRHARAAPAPWRCDSPECARRPPPPHCSRDADSRFPLAARAK